MLVLASVHIHSSSVTTLRWSLYPATSPQDRVGRATSLPAIACVLDRARSHILHIRVAGGSLVVVPSLTPISGNGPLPGANQVINHTGHAAIGAQFTMMLDNAKYIGARHIIKPSVDRTI